MGYNITNINGDLAIGRNAEIGCDADIHGKARVAGSLKVEGFLDAPNIKGVVKGLFVTEEELNREYPNPRPGWCAIVLADDERGFLYLAKSRKWEKQSEEAKPFDFIVDSISVFASKGELEAERLRATEAEEQLRSGIEQEATRATEAENNIKSQALLIDTVHFSQGTRGVSLGGRSIDGRSVVDELIPVATTEMAGAMSPEDKVQILNNKKDIENTNISIEELKTVLADGSFIVAVASLANSVKAGAVTFEMLDGHLKLSASVVDDLETANTLMPLSANQGKVLKDLIDIINGTGEGSTDKKITDAIAKLVNRAPENLDTLKELADWTAEHGTEFAGVVADINNIKDDALLTSSVHVSQYAEKINIGGRSLDGANTMSVDIPAATTENAGVMSAEDKQKLIELDSNLVKIDGIGYTSTSAGVDRDGFVYYNLTSRTVHRCTAFTGVPGGSSYINISNTKALYVWENHIYEWDADRGLYCVKPTYTFDDDTNLLHRGFVKECYIHGDNVLSYSGWKITTIRRNVNGKWEVYLRDLQKSIVFIYSADKEEAVFRISQSGITAYFVVDWSVVAEGTDWNENGDKRYLLSNKVTELGYSPKISEILLSSEFDEKIKSTNGILFENDYIVIYELYIAKNIIDKGFSPSTITFYNAFSDLNYVGVKFDSLLDSRSIFNSKDVAKALLNKGLLNFPSFKMKFKIKTEAESFLLDPNYILPIISTDLERCKEIHKAVMEEYDSITEDCIDMSSVDGGYYISIAGFRTSTSNSSFAISELIPCSEGDIVKVNTSSSNVMSVISEYNGESYTPLVIGSDTNYDYEYRVKRDSIIAVSFNKSKGGISIIRRNNQTLQPTLTFETGKYIGSKGAVQYSSNDSYGISEPIKVYKGDNILLSIQGSADINAVICITNGINNDYQPVVIADSSNYKEYNYLVLEDGYVVVSGNASNTPSMVITRRANPKDKTPYYKEKNYYVNDCNYIPENYGSILVYDGDNKVSENHIVNAVAYPNGEIIACRVGKVVKIANDGSETVLLTIAGATDWRCCYIDKQYNVYVSPHNSFSIDGVIMKMTDRGLYRLKYGESQFEKVVSLYNPLSSITTETEENDDTIWTMCEDSKGNIYAGVYAHTVRPNASVYKSTNGGATWNVVSNLIDIADESKGRASHIHCIIYNQYNNSLYCIVGEVETVYKSTDGGVTWVDLNVWVEDEKGTTMIAVPDGILIGSDGSREGVISKLYSDDKTVKVVGKMWHAEFFGMRRSDLTGWIYAMTKIESTINSSSVYPPYEAIHDSVALQEWIDTAAKGRVKGWNAYHNWVDMYYNHDSIHPTNAAILVSKDNGESWEVIYKHDTKTATGVGMGIWCVGYFANGECLCSMSEDKNGIKTFINPVIIREGKLKYSQEGIDLSGDIFIKTNDNVVLV